MLKWNLLYMSIHVTNVCVCVCEHVYQSQQSGVFLSHSMPYFFETGLSLNLELHLAGLICQQPSRMHLCLTFRFSAEDT